MNSPQVTRHSSLGLLSVIIPARDEEGCIASTVEHLHLELDLRGVPHEFIVIDDGSTDRTWEILQEEARRLNSSASVTQVCHGLSPSAAADSGSGFTSPPSSSTPSPTFAPSNLPTFPPSATADSAQASGLTSPPYSPPSTQVSNSAFSPRERPAVLRPIQNPGSHGFGRAITLGLWTSGLSVFAWVALLGVTSAALILSERATTVRS